MTGRNLRILCVDNGTDVSRLVGSIYNTIPHEIKTVYARTNLVDIIKEESFDILVLDNHKHHIGIDQVRKIKVLNPDLYTVIIEENYDALDQWSTLDRLRLIGSNDLAVKLPLHLGDIYDFFSSRTEKGIEYWKLLQDALDAVESVIIVVNQMGKLVFLNSQARDMLLLDAETYRDMYFTDIIEEGTRVWKYLAEHSLKEGRPIMNHALSFVDSHGSEHRKIINCNRIGQGEGYLLLQNISGTIDEEKLMLEGEHQLLDNFADSIANELLNPVNIISGRIQLLQSDLQDQDNHLKSLNVLNKQVDRINETVAKLLTFARMKQDAVPQKVHINEALRRIRMEPSVLRLLEKDETRLTYDLADDIPVFPGMLTQIDLLLKTILELAFQCLGSDGKIAVRTALFKGYKDMDWVELQFMVDYERDLVSRDCNLKGIIGQDRSGKGLYPIEATIVNHILRRYQAVRKIIQNSRRQESLRILFPLSESK